MNRFADEYLEYWGDVFAACRLAGEGVSFEEFLTDPRAVLEAHGQEDAPEIMAQGFLPLLPAQARARREWAAGQPVCQVKVEANDPGPFRGMALVPVMAG